MRIEIIIFLGGIGFYVWLKRKSIWPSILAIFSSYLLIFLVGSIPGLLYTLTHISNINSTNIDVFSYINNLIIHSNIFHNTLHETAFSVTPIRFFELGFNKLVSQILFIMSIAFVSILFYKTDYEKFKIIIKNSRLNRIIFYLSLLFLGMGFAYVMGYRLISWVDILSTLCLIISWINIWLYAVQINDIEDVEIDKISNKNRPLVQGTISIENMKEVGYVFLGTALLGAWSVGFYQFYMSIIGLFVSYIYSAKPLRLKRIPILSTFLISIACLITVLAGFFFVSIDKTFQTFPTLLILGILTIFTLGINIKDMKDIEGDRAGGIKTLPVIFRKRGANIVGLCFALSLLLVPIFISFYILYIISIPLAIIGYKLITKIPYRETPVFRLVFMFLILMTFLFMISPWLVNLL
jgi:4-hydroxybenzoate polyprenyltransferase